MARTHPLRQFTPLLAILGILLVIGVVALLTRGGGDGPSTSVEQAQKEALAAKLLTQGEPAKSLQLLEEIELNVGPKGLPEKLALLKIKALEGTGNMAALSREAAAFLQKFPESTSKTEVHLTYLTAEVESAGLSNPMLLKNVESFVAEHPSHDGVGRLTLALARHELAIGDHAAARRRLSAALASDSLDPESISAMRREMGDLNMEAFFRGDSPAVTMVTHTVKSGDSVWGIARKYDVTSELLMKVNNIEDPTKLRVGQTLNVPQVDFSLVCDISRNELTLYANNEFLKTYVVRTGREAGTTPTGEFKILNKKVGPTWRPGDGRVYLPGDPNNELGTRWMSFEGDILGIHGTIHPETVGHYASNGCIGMLTEDVEELFDLVDVGTPLKIVGKQDTTHAKILPEREVPAPLSEREIAALR
ncbi:MAG: hypothetical protein PWP23_3085 [Candidatus Sumerlaeota bacterium]|nr:hypothetical protein [Candidatus Sumerlaeota bacterium]